MNEKCLHCCNLEQEHGEYYCDISGIVIDDVETIPFWCPLPEEAEEDTP